MYILFFSECKLKARPKVLVKPECVRIVPDLAAGRSWRGHS